MNNKYSSINEMLSGIKKGKKKRKLEKNTSKPAKKPSAPISSDNQNAAEELRRMLAGSSKIPKASFSSSSTIFNDTSIGSNDSSSVIDRFEQRRGNLAAVFDNQDATIRATEKVVMINSDAAVPTNQKEDFRNGARKGKLKQKGSYLHAEADKSIDEMVAEERRTKQQGGSASMDEVFARNIARLGSRYKGAEFKSVAGATAGADEDDMAGDGGIDMKMFTSNEERLTEAARYNREMSRQVARAKQEEKITSRCWWWMESSSFQKHRLLSLGDHVSLILVPSHNALVNCQCFLVPVQHAESFSSCEDEVWEEVARFRSSLRKMFAKEGKGVLFCETVLDTKGLWQARMDVIPVPKTVEQDAEMYFKSALTEQAEEWGTHTKILSTRGRGLRHTVPKGFSYFNVEWDGGGFAQIIENRSFPKDFAADTIAGMMELDPLRFNRKKKAADYDKGAILDFLKRWKEFDWTIALDEGITQE